MKIVFFNRFFHPDGSATSQLLSDLAFGLAAQGREVHVVASHGAAQLAGRETVHGVEVHRVAAGDSGAHGLTARSMAHARYYLAARRAAPPTESAGGSAQRAGG